MIRAVTFDLDDTLFDFQACMTLGAARVVEALRERHPATAALASVERFHHLWHEATEEARTGGEAIDWPRVRRRGIERLTVVCDCFEEALVEELTTLYFQHRHAPVSAFEDAAAAVGDLGGRLPLGIISNASTDLAQIGMAGRFQIILNPGTTPYRKPDPRIFHQAATALGCAPEEMLHVGDRWEDDIVGALEAGCQAAWYRRSDRSGGDTAVRTATFTSVQVEGADRPHLLVDDLRAVAAWVHSRFSEYGVS